MSGSLLITGDGNHVQVHLDHLLARPRQVTRYPDVACPERVGLGTKRFQVVVRLCLRPSELSIAESPPLDLSGIAVRVRLDAPAFDPLGPLEQETVVLPDASGPPVVFDLRPKSAGRHPLALIFFQDGTLLGRLSWDVEVVAEEAVAEQALSWRPSALALSPDPAAPPDRLLEVAYLPGDPPRLRFRLEEKGVTRHPDWEVCLRAGPATAARSLYEHLGRLSLQTDPASPHPYLLDPEEVWLRFRSFGQTLWRELFPLELRDLYAEHRQEWQGTSLLLYIAEPHIPWELAWPYGAGWEDEGPWALTLDLSRWLFGERQTAGPQSRLYPSAFGCIAPPHEGLPAGLEEVAFVRGLLTGRGLRERSPAGATWREVRKWLEAGAYDWVHIVTHGNFAAEAPERQGVLQLEDGQALTPSDLGGPLLEQHWRKVHPVVVLNACDAGRLGWAWTGLGGWAQRLVELQAGALLAPLWMVQDEAAATFIRRFYEGLFEHGETLARAVRQARRHVLQAHDHNPSCLAYTLYAHPNGSLEKSRPLPSFAG